jgi:arylsulfatase A-like enzyme
VLIVVDTLRADRLSQYGHSRDTSGSLGRLTGAATRFEECYSPAAWTAPSVASLFTGLAPGRHRVDSIGAALPENTSTLARSLRAAGWQTAAVSFNPHITRRSRFDQGFDEFVSYRGKARRAPDIRALLAEALQWIDEVRDDGRGPFFLYLQPMNVHGPYRVPEDAQSLLLGRPPRKGFEFFGPLMQELMNDGRLERRGDVTPEFLLSLEEQYDTAIRHSSEELGRFFDALQARGLWDSSLVVLTSDHGEELFDHGGFAHRYSLYREVLHIPLFVKLPGQTESRAIVEPVSLVDLRATLEDLLGLPVAHGDGRSLAPLLSEDVDESPQPEFDKSPQPELDKSPQRGFVENLRGRYFVAQASNPKRFVGRSLRVGDEELIVTSHSYDGLENVVRLYDLREDPGQQNDLAQARPDRVARLIAELERIESKYAEAPLSASRYSLTPAARKALEALGYF